MRGKYYTLLSLFPLTIMLLYYVPIYKIMCIYEVCIKPVLCTTSYTFLLWRKYIKFPQMNMYIFGSF